MRDWREYRKQPDSTVADPTPEVPRAGGDAGPPQPAAPAEPAPAAQCNVAAMRILIIEDERKTAAFLRQGLAEAGFQTDVALDGEDGLGRALSVDHALIILDAMLPGRDGWQVLGELRRRGKSLPVLLLTARGAVSDRVKGLELGADDYLVKPYAFAELLARVRALLRRRTECAHELLAIADLRIDLLRQRAQRQEAQLELSPREFALLALLAARRGEVLSRRVIAEQVWDVDFECDSNVIDVAVRRLRRKVDDPFAPVAPRLIHTVRGLGYVLQAD
jgi:two-component system, OmpR family, copper resistance phosphate regulon response regulator CusR